MAERLLSGWGGTAPSSTDLIETDVPGLKRLLEAPPARGVIARGLGRSYGDPAQNAGGATVKLTELDGVQAFDETTGQVTVGAGMSLGALIDRVLPAGWLPAVVPGTRHVTVGGAIACDVHGKNHARQGGFCDHVAWLDLLTPSREVVRLSPAEQPDAFRATAGGMGATGFVLSACLQLRRVGTALFRERAWRVEDIDAAMAELDDEEASEYALAWVDCLTGSSVVLRGDHATRDELPPGARLSPLRNAWPHAVPMPPLAPSGLVNRASVGAFNTVNRLRFPRSPRERIASLSRFLFPQDAVAGGGRLFGRHGLVQYQFAVPSGSADTVRSVLEAFRAARVPAALGILKRLGPGGGMLSFPCAGWALSVDIPASFPALRRTLDDADARVAAAGGRVYLAKDSRLRPDALAVMYPELPRWREQRALLDPGGVMRSDLLRRLELVR